MDNNKLLEKYIEKVDRDQSDLRNDIRASEERIAKNIELSETRNEERLKRMENMIYNYMDKIDNEINRLQDKIDNKIDRLQDKIDNSNKYIKNLSIVTIIGIAAMVISTLVALFIALIKMTE